MADVLGHTKKHKLQGWQDWDVKVDDDSQDDPEDFVDPKTFDDRQAVVIDDGEGRDIEAEAADAADDWSAIEEDDSPAFDVPPEELPEE